MRTRGNRRGSEISYQLTVCRKAQKNFGARGTTPGGFESFRQPVIPPAPLTGDVGRGCGDASRALLLFSDRKTPRCEQDRRLGFGNSKNAVHGVPEKNGALSGAPFFLSHHGFSAHAVLRPPSAPGCASCAGRTAPGSRPRRPSRAGTASRSGTQARGARRSGSVRDRR